MILTISLKSRIRTGGVSMPDLPGHDRREERRARRHHRRLVYDGDTYTEPELERGEVELVQVARRDEPDVNVQGEPWDWTKLGDRPKGWPGPEDNPEWRNEDEPGPYDGSWDPPGEVRR
jgi:hypothetical protein